MGGWHRFGRVRWRRAEVAVLRARRRFSGVSSW